MLCVCVCVSFRKSAEKRTIASSAIHVTHTHLLSEGNQQQDCSECVQSAGSGGQHLYSHVCSLIALIHTLGDTLCQNKG